MTAHICHTDDTSCRDCGLPTDSQYVGDQAIDGLVAWARDNGVTVETVTYAPSRGPQDGVIVAMLDGATMLCSYCEEEPVRTAGDAYCEDCLTTIYGQPPVCERCNEPQWTGTMGYATPGDFNSPEWCESCRKAVTP